MLEWLVAALVQASSVTAAPPPTVSIPASAPDLAAIVTRGQLLYLYDQAAWHSTDAMLKDIPDPAAAGVRGWIVEPRDRALRVTYYGEGAQPTPIYVADFQNRKVSGARLVPVAERRPLSDGQQRMILARSPARADRLERCVPQPFNTVVVPGTAGAPLDVYYLTPQTKIGIWPMGRHYRLRVGTDDKSIDTRAFSRSCLAIGLEGLPKGARPTALFVNHIVDPVPTEIHVFTALASGIPLIVQTSSGRWWVDGRAIRKVPETRRAN